MLKIRVTYPNGKGGTCEKDVLLQLLQSNYNIIGVSREYQSRASGLFKSVYIDLDNTDPF